jgi:hypothetical protein
VSPPAGHERVATVMRVAAPGHRFTAIAGAVEIAAQDPAFRQQAAQVRARCQPHHHPHLRVQPQQAKQQQQAPRANQQMWLSHIWTGGCST